MIYVLLQETIKLWEDSLARTLLHKLISYQVIQLIKLAIPHIKETNILLWINIKD